MPSCAVDGCPNNHRHKQVSLVTTGKELRFFRFPASETRRQYWTAMCGRTDKINVKSAVICSDHFTPSDFERNLQAELLGYKCRPKLNKVARPRLHLPEGVPTCPSPVHEEVETETTKLNKKEKPRLQLSQAAPTCPSPVTQEETNLIDFRAVAENITATVSKAKNPSPVETVTTIVSYTKSSSTVSKGKCLICQRHVHVSKVDQQGNFLVPNTKVFFLLKEVLELPLKQLECFLKSGTDLIHWVKICRNCDMTYVRKCWKLWAESLEVLRKFEESKLQLVKAVKFWSEQVKSQETPQKNSTHLAMGINDISEETRRFVEKRKFQHALMKVKLKCYIIIYAGF